MIKNYITLAFRHLWKHKLYSFINITGLSVGISACLLIAVYITHEWSYDRFHQNASRLYTLYGSVNSGTDSIFVPDMSYATAPLLKHNIPAIEHFMRLKQPNNQVPITKVSDKSRFFEKKFIFADVNFFSFFSFNLLSGNIQDVIATPFKVTITERIAKKYFGAQNPLGQLLRYDNKYTFEVTGVTADPPSNSSIDFDFVASLSSLALMKEYQASTKESFPGLGDYKTYFQLAPHTSAVHVKEAIQRATKEAERNENANFHLMPFISSHLSLNFGDASNIKYIRIFPAIALIILMLAIINYMSLSIAWYSLRGKEIGVRKSVGAGSHHIAVQFYVESALYILLAFMAGYLIFSLAMPYFYNLLKLSISTDFLLSPLSIGVSVTLFLLTMLISGSYPSVILSSMNPVFALSSKHIKKKGQLNIRQFFVTFQFTISIILITCSIIMNRQLHYFKHADTGMQKDNVVMVPFGEGISAHYLSVKNHIRSLKGVQNVSTASYPMYNGYDMSFAQPKEQTANISFPSLFLDESFISLLGLKWKYPPANAVHANGIVINEAAISKLNLPADPRNEVVLIGGQQFAVAGVLKDFNYTSMQTQISGLLMFVEQDTSATWRSGTAGCFYIKVSSQANVQDILNEVSRSYNNYDPNTPFYFQFLTDAFNDQYKSEYRLSSLINIFTLLTISIAAMGLFALAIFSANTKVKEIGVRKVLGASTYSIIHLLTVNFIKLVLFSILIASPIAWVLAGKWLNNFAYRIPIKWYYFAESYLIAILIAILTVSYTALKTASVNPLKSLQKD